MLPETPSGFVVTVRYQPEEVQFKNKFSCSLLLKIFNNSRKEARGRKVWKDDQEQEESEMKYLEGLVNNF